MEHSRDEFSAVHMNPGIETPGIKRWQGVYHRRSWEALSVLNDHHDPLVRVPLRPFDKQPLQRRNT